MAVRRSAHWYALVVNLPAAHLSPGTVITHAHDPGGVLDLGRYPDAVDALCAQVADTLTRAGFSARSDAPVMRQKYAKLLVNLNNALQAATNMAQATA